MSRRKFTPYEYQRLATDFMLSTPRCSLFAGMGTGKTVSALSVAEALILTGTEDPILVLGPLRVARETWSRELAKWEHLEHLYLVPIVGDTEKRKLALNTLAHIYTCNYEQLPWLVAQFEGKPWPFKIVVSDESTRLKGYRFGGPKKDGTPKDSGSGGLRTNALAKVARKTERWINMTGTPAANGLKDLWGQYWFLDFGQRLGRTHGAFMDRWFKTNQYTRKVEPFPHSEREIHGAIADITLSIRSEDWFDVEKPIERRVPVYLDGRLLAQYKQLEIEMFTKLACGTEVEVFNAAELTNKCRQFANGAVYTDRPAWAAVHDLKLEALSSIVEEANGASVMVSYEFVSDRERLLKHFKNDIVDLSKAEGFKRFVDGNARIGIAHPQSMGHGIDGLQEVCNMLVYFGHGWNLEHRQQILERIGPVRQLQAGKKRNVWVWSIVADGTIDDDVLERHESKRGVQDILLEAMTRRNIK